MHQALYKTSIRSYRLGKEEDTKEAAETVNLRSYLGSVEFQI